jgi:hypothetical protein
MWQIPDDVDTVVCAPDDGWKYRLKYIEHFPNINKLCNVASCWIYEYIGILLGIHYILHVSRIRFKSVGASVQSTNGRRAVHINVHGLYCSCKPVFCGHVTYTGYPFHSFVSPSLLRPCVTVCHHISTGLYKSQGQDRRDRQIQRSDPI